MKVFKNTYMVLGLVWALACTTLEPVMAEVNPLILPQPGTLVGLSPAYKPPMLKGLKIHPEDPLRFDFILDKGDVGRSVKDSSPRAGDFRWSSASPQNDYVRLIKYFLASLTVPEKDWWVNLSPYEKDRIVPDALGQTAMGRDILAQDYILKQVTASLMYPEGETGRKFWKEIYTKAARQYGSTQVPVSTFNKVWIVPGKVEIYENTKSGTAYVVESTLKVMLEQDYVALQRNRSGERVKRVEPQDYLALSKNVIPATNGSTRYEGAKAGIHSKMDARQKHSGMTDELPSQILRELVIPQLTKEVNEGKNFAQLRQVYNSLILANWYKKKIKESILAKIYADKNKIEGLQPTRGHVQDRTTKNVSPSRLPSNNGLNVKATEGADPLDVDPLDVDAIYHRYLDAFKKGVYNYIKEEPDPTTGRAVPRKYFSGGATFFQLDQAMTVRETWAAVMDKAAGLSVVRAVLRPAQQVREKVRATTDKLQQMRAVIRMFRGKSYDEAVNELLMHMERLQKAGPGTDGSDPRAHFIEAVAEILGDDDPLSMALRQYHGGDFALYFYNYWGLPTDQIQAIQRTKPYRVLGDKSSYEDDASLRLWQAHVEKSLKMLSEANELIGPRVRGAMLRLANADTREIIKPFVPQHGWRFSIPSRSQSRLVNGVFRTAATLALVSSLSSSMPQDMFDPQQREMAALDQTTVLSRIIDEVQGWSSTQWEIHSRATQAQSIVNDIREKYPPQRVRAALDAFPNYRTTKATDLHHLFWNVLRPYMAYQPGEAGIQPGEILEKVDQAYHDKALNEALNHFLTARRDGQDPQFRLGFFGLREYFVHMHQFIMGMFSQDGIFLMTGSEIRSVVKMGAELLNTRFPGVRLDPFDVFVLSGPHGYPRPSYAGITYPVRDLPAGTGSKTTDYYAVAWEDRNAPSGIPWRTVVHEAGHVATQASQRRWRVPNTELEALLSELILIPVDERFTDVMKHLVASAEKNDVYGLASQSILRALAKANGMEWRPGLAASAFDHVQRLDIRRQAQDLWADPWLLKDVPPGKGELEYDDLTAGDGKSYASFRKWFANLSAGAAATVTGYILYYLYRRYRKLEEKRANERVEAEPVEAEPVEAERQETEAGAPDQPQGVYWDEPSLGPFLDAIIREGGYDAPHGEQIRREMRTALEKYYHERSSWESWKKFMSTPEEVWGFNYIQKTLFTYLLAFPPPLYSGLSRTDRIRLAVTPVNDFEFQRQQVIARMAKALRQYPQQDDPAAYLSLSLVRIISDALEEPDEGDARFKRLRFLPPRLRVSLLGAGIPREGLEGKYWADMEGTVDLNSLNEALEAAVLQISLNEMLPTNVVSRGLAVNSVPPEERKASVILDLRSLLNVDGTVNQDWMQKFARAWLMAGPEIDRFLIIKGDGAYEALPVDIADGADAREILVQYMMPYLGGGAYDFFLYKYDFYSKSFQMAHQRRPNLLGHQQTSPTLPKIVLPARGETFSAQALRQDLQLERGDVFVVSTDEQIVLWKEKGPAGGYFQVPGFEEIFRDPGHFVEYGQPAGGTHQAAAPAQSLVQTTKLPPGMKLGELYYKDIDPNKLALLYVTAGNFTDAEMVEIYGSASRFYGDNNLMFYPYDPDKPVTQLENLPEEATLIFASKGGDIKHARRADHYRPGWIEQVYVKDGADEFENGAQLSGDFYYSLGFDRKKDTLLYIARRDMPEEQRVRLFRSVERENRGKYNVLFYAQDGSSGQRVPVSDLMEAAKKYGGDRGGGEGEIKIQFDSAQASTSQPTGGIDLTGAQDMHINADALSGIRFQLDPAQLARLQNAPGFTPEVLDISPLSNLRGFLGAARD